MADEAHESIHIEASPDRCYAVAIDFDRYPEWATDVKQVEVLQRDGEGRGTLVRYEISALGKSIGYVLGYDYADAPGGFSWRLEKADYLRRLDGTYRFDADGGWHGGRLRAGRRRHPSVARFHETGRGGHDRRQRHEAAEAIHRIRMISEDRIRALAGHRGSCVVTSCYLDVDGRRHPRHADYETRLDHLVRQGREKAVGFGPEAVRSVAADLERIAGWVRGGFDRSHVRGLAFFACSADSFFEVVESPLPVRNGIVVNHTPHVRPLESILQAYERFAVVLVDRQRARLFRFELGELTECTEVFDAVPRGTAAAGHPAQGSRGAHVQRHTEEVAHRHLKHAADVAFTELGNHAVDHVILGGPHEVVVEFEGLLHPWVGGRVADRLTIPATAGPDEVRQAALAVEGAVTRRSEAALVERLRDAVGTGVGVAGLEPTLSALVERRVDLLLVSDGYEPQGWRCRSCRYLGPLGRRCPVCANSMDLVDDVVEEAVEEALANKCRVQFVRENADLDVLGRIGALLRF